VIFAVMSDRLAGQWWSDGSTPPATTPHLREAICRALDKALPYTLWNASLATLRQLIRIPDPDHDHEKKEDPETMKSEEGSTQIVKGKNKFSHVTVSTSKDEEIHLPEGMSKAQARDWLTKIEQAEEQKINWSESFDAYPLDGALALRRVLERRFGSAVKEGATQKTFFGEKEVPPYMIALETGVDTTEYVPWGYFVIPPMPDCKIRTGLNYANKQLVFTLSGEIKRKYKPLMDDISVQLREQLATGSIYKGKAFRLNFASREEQEAEGYNPFDYMPRFINTSSTSDKLILSDKVREQIETNIFTPVEHTDTCRKLGVPIKRGILLEGRYGVGKSLTAHVLSRVCVENGWTFIYLQNVMALEDAMRFARRYEPAVIFAEDIDGAMQQKEGSARDQAMNAILNTIDGVDMKKSEQMVVLTTNFVDRINKAMLRPGRLDAVISVDPPDEGAVIQLLKHYARGLLDKVGDDDLRPAAALLAGQIPSVIREVVERSKLASIRRAAGKQDGALLAGDDLRVAAQGIMSHIALLRESEPDKRSDIEKAADRLAHGLMKGSSNGRSDKSSPGPVVDLQRFGGTTS
jgi:transitional endoplasmic reticulum ATPase